MIQRLIWDTDFFGYPIGKLLVKKEEAFNFEEFKQQSIQYKLIYVFTEIELNDYLGLDQFDQKVVLSKKIDGQENKLDSIRSFCPQKDSYMEILELCYLSGIYSRYKIDHNFRDYEFKKLYKQWLDNSLSKRFAFDVLVKKIEGEIAGFVSIGKTNNITSHIGLIAVSKYYQKKGIAKELIKAAEQISKNAGYNIIQVASQLANIPAVNLYKSCGYNIDSVLNIYHFWNK